MFEGAANVGIGGGNFHAIQGNATLQYTTNNYNAVDLGQREWLDVGSDDEDSDISSRIAR